MLRGIQINVDMAGSEFCHSLKSNQVSRGWPPPKDSWHSIHRAQPTRFHKNTIWGFQMIKYISLLNFDNILSVRVSNPYHTFSCNHISLKEWIMNVTAMHTNYAFVPLATRWPHLLILEGTFQCMAQPYIQYQPPKAAQHPAFKRPPYQTAPLNICNQEAPLPEHRNGTMSGSYR